MLSTPELFGFRSTPCTSCFGKLLFTSLWCGLSVACVEGVSSVDGNNGGVVANPGGGDFAEVTKGVSGGLNFPEGWEDYAVIGASDRTDGGDNSTIVLLLGNTTAVNSARAIASNQQTTWDEGSSIVRLVWSDQGNQFSADTLGSGSFASLTLMTKDSNSFADAGGWGYGLWRGNDLTSADTTQPIVNNETCFACHDREVSNKDYVFTNPMALPGPDAFQAAATSSDIAIPQQSPNWKFIGVHKRLGAGQVRVLTGNDIAVNAIRSGNVAPDWPDGAQIADFVFAGSENEEWLGADGQAAMLETGDFAALAYMVKDSNTYPQENGFWGYGFWRGAGLEAADAANEPIVNNETCADCHNREVGANGLQGANDYVFTIPAPLPTNP